MPSTAGSDALGRDARRAPVTRERILAAAVRLADAHGLEAVSMRRVGQELGVEAMSLYKHVAGKEAILDGIADLVWAEVEVPDPADGGWRAALRRSAISAHAVLLRHPWASGLVESRANPGPARLRYLEAVVGTLRDAGASLPMVGRALMALDSHTYGFTLQELAFPFRPDTAAESAAALVEGLPAAAYPNLAAMAGMVAAGGEGFELDFAFGLDILLDGIERRLADG